MEGSSANRGIFVLSGEFRVRNLSLDLTTGGGSATASYGRRLGRIGSPSLEDGCDQAQEARTAAMEGDENEGNEASKTSLEREFR
ncbi:MAG TPA: hypothetical protein VN213_06400 [Solirubrobacteraceae bacterium]|nr:hypothetical protein [Solirubrobacteraceae bacterium]